MNPAVKNAIDNISAAYGHCGSNFGYEVLKILAGLPFCEQAFDGYMLAKLNDGVDTKDNYYYSGKYLWAFPWTVNHMPLPSENAMFLSSDEVAQTFIDSGYEKNIEQADGKLRRIHDFAATREWVDDEPTMPCEVRALLLCFCELLGIDKPETEYILDNVAPFLTFVNNDFAHIADVIDTVDDEVLNKLTDLIDIIDWHMSHKSDTEKKLMEQDKSWTNTDITDAERRKRTLATMDIFIDSGVIVDYQAALTGVPLRDILV